MIELIKLKYLINKKQSLKYQIMLILMEEHKKARLGEEFIGEYDGGNELLFDPISWKKMKKKIIKYISVNYKENFKRLNNSYIFGLFSERKGLCILRKINLKQTNVEKNTNQISIFKLSEINDDEYNIGFSMTDAGYSYQYNGYKKTQDKLQYSANLFVFMTLIYYMA